MARVGAPARQFCRASIKEGEEGRGEKVVRGHYAVGFQSREEGEEGRGECVDGARGRARTAIPPRLGKSREKFIHRDARQCEAR